MAGTGRSVMESVRQLWRHARLDEGFLTHLELTGNADAAIPSSFKVGHLAQATTAAAGLAASAVLNAKSGGTEPAVKATVNARHAILNFASEAYTLIDGKVPGDVWDDLAGLYPTKDGHVRIHTNFPHHRQGILDLLGCEGTREAVGKALQTRTSVEFESEASAAGMCVSALRTFTEWDQHPQSKVLKGKLPFELVKIGDAPPRSVIPSTLKEGKLGQPLDGVRVVELTRVIAGPVAGRTLASFGADVLWITSPNLPSLPDVDLDTSRGKRAAQLDLNEEGGVDKLRELVKGCDVFLQSYRPGALEKRGFGPRELAEVRPGIVVANLRGYGWEGPWAEKRAFDSLVQAATGFNRAEGKAYALAQGEDEATASTRIKTLPVQCLDHGAGQLLAFGVMAALARSFTEGGSWEVRVSLAGVGQWLRDLGQLPLSEAFKGTPLPPRTRPMHQEIQDWSEEWVAPGTDKTSSESRVELEGINKPRRFDLHNAGYDNLIWREGNTDKRIEGLQRSR
ncbi:CoA-transferase family III [Serendipita vermifera]|nr:CoA-transferase family III [Serendipita vermifera]